MERLWQEVWCDWKDNCDVERVSVAGRPDKKRRVLQWFNEERDTEGFLVLFFFKLRITYIQISA